MPEQPRQDRHRIQHRHWMLLTFVLLAAAALRMLGSDLFVMWQDEFVITRLANRIFEGGERLLIGPVATFDGLSHHSPLVAYVVAGFFSVAHDPAIARLGIALLGVVSLALWFVTVRRYFGWSIALVALLLLAVSAQLIYWQRFVWNPNIGHIAIPLWYLTALMGYHENKAWAKALHWLALSLNVQAQAGLLWMVPFSLLLVAWDLWQRRTNLWGVIRIHLLSFGLLLLSLLPWLIGLQQFAATRSVEATNTLATLSQLISTVNSENLARLPNVFAGLVGSTNFPWGYLATFPNTRVAEAIRPLSWLGAFQAVLTAIGGLALLWQGLRGGKQAVPALWLSAMTVLPLSAGLFLPQAANDYYFVSITFTGSLCLAYLIVRLWQRFGRSVRFVLGILLFGIVVAQLIQFSIYLRILDQQAHWYPNGNIVTLSRQAEAWLAQAPSVRIIREPELERDLEAPRKFAVSELYASWDVMRWRYPAIEIIEPDQSIPIARDRTLLVAFPHSQLLPRLVDDLSIIEDAAGQVRYLQAVITPDDWLPDEGLTMRFGDVAALQDVRADLCSVTETQLALLWQPLRPDEGKLYHFSVRLLDANGNTLVQQDFPALRSADWHVGDTVLTQVTLPHYQDATQIGLVMYEFAGSALPVFADEQATNSPVATITLDC